MVSQPRRQSNGPLQGMVKRHSKPKSTCLLNSSHIIPTAIRDTTTISKTGPTIVVGLLKLRVPRQNSPAGSAPPKAIRARDKATHRMARRWHYLEPHQGDLTSLNFVSESQPGGFLHVPPCGLASSCPGSSDRDYPGTTYETTRPKFVLGGICPCLVLWRGTCPCWLSPTYGDSGSTQILTRHYSVKSQIVSQLMNMGTTPTRQVPS
jgi:hypothetical protein